MCCSTGVAIFRIKIKCYSHLTYIVTKLETFFAGLPSNWTLRNEIPSLEEIKQKHLQWAEVLEIRIGHIGSVQRLIVTGQTYMFRNHITRMHPPTLDKNPNHIMWVWNPDTLSNEKKRDFAWYHRGDVPLLANILSRYATMAEAEMCKVNHVAAIIFF